MYCSIKCTILATCLLTLLPAPRNLSAQSCVTVTITTLTSAERGKLPPAASQIQRGVSVRWENGAGRPVSLQSQASQVQLCAASTTGLTLAALQTRIATLLTDQAAEDTANTNRESQRQTDRTSAQTKLRNLGLTQAEIDAFLSNGR